MTTTNTNGSIKPGRTLTPPADLYETADEYVVQADLPGVSADNLDVQFENGELTILGRRTERTPGDAVLCENAVTAYRRSFQLADHIDGNGIDATLNGGVLTLKLPKSEGIKPRKIQVKC